MSSRRFSLDVPSPTHQSATASSPSPPLPSSVRYSASLGHTFTIRSPLPPPPHNPNEDESENGETGENNNNSSGKRGGHRVTIQTPTKSNYPNYTNYQRMSRGMRTPERLSMSVNSNEDSPLLLENKKGAYRYDHDSHSKRSHAKDPLNFPKYRHTLTEKDKEKMAGTESLDYVHVDNEAYRTFEKHRPASSRLVDEILRWVLVGMIGITTGAISYGLHMAVESIYDKKFDLVFEAIPFSKNRAFLIFILFNGGLTLIAALAICFEPAASGSGLPEVKGYLNGVRIPRAFNFRNLWATLVSIICSVSSSLPVGPEGPMIHIGGMVGGGIGEMRSRTLGISFDFFPRFQNSRDRRDFISCGAACGVAAAFGAPIGGVLFALEEASSFWSQRLTWRTFFGTMMAVLTMNIGLSGFTGTLNMQADILFDIDATIDYYDIAAVLIPCIFLGVMGGVLGGTFTYLNLKLNKMRLRYVNHRKWLRVIEALVIVFIFSFALLYIPSFFDCRKIPDDPTASTNTAAYKVNAYTCPEGYYNDFATLALSPQEQSVSHLIGVQDARFSTLSLVMFCLLYFTGALITAGTGISSGLFVPMMIIGGSYGRALGHLMDQWKAADIDLGIYGLIGAASFMSGVTRMTVSLVVILIEVTNDIQFLLPVIIVIMISKGVGDYITFPLYDAQLSQKSIPFLESEPLDVMATMTCEDTMAKDVMCFADVEKVSVLLHALNMTRHNGFPVVTIGAHGDLKFKGIILRRQILVLLKYSLFTAHATGRVTHANFRDLLNGPRLTLADIRITQMDLNAEVELWYYMNRSVMVVHPEMNLAMAFRLFRTMGLRHLPVVNDDNNVVGMITRKDLLHEVCEQKYHEKKEEEEAERERRYEQLQEELEVLRTSQAVQKRATQGEPEDREEIDNVVNNSDPT